MRRATPPAALLFALLLALPAATAAAGVPTAAGASAAAGSTTATAGTTVPGSTTAQDGGGPCTGTIAEPADGSTVVTVQGTRFGAENGAKKTIPRLVGFGPRGEVQWVREAADEVVWYYDVDPMANGNLFVVAAFREEGKGKTMFFEFDPERQERVWTERIDVKDTHDADLLDEHRIAVAQMRGYDNETDETHDGLVIYNRTSDEIEDRWRFFADGGYPEEAGGDYEEDWTHLNDVDRIGEDRYLLSPRNFDQVVVVNLATDEIELQVGEDNDYETMKRQHNPQYLESSDGTPTVLVADSDNDRIVEYERTDDGWNRTWTLVGGDGLFWPRDADRLPNGNTLVVDSRNDRVLEVTPEGEAVWEAYAPWLLYDAERIPYGDEAEGHEKPTTTDLDATGQVPLRNAPTFEPDAREDCDAHLKSFEPGEVRNSSDGNSSNGDDSSNSSSPSNPDEGEAQPGFGVGPALAAAGIAVLLLAGRAAE